MPPTTRFHLIRHGEVFNPRHVVYGTLPGYGLSERGQRQAHQVAERLAGAPLVAVWSSPLERALRTAEVLAAPHRLPMMVDDDLTEWRLAERWAGIVWADLPTERPGELEAYLADPAGLAFAPESLAALADRMEAAIERLVSRYPGKSFAVVSHQDPIQSLKLSLLGRPLAALWDGKPVHGAVLTFEAPPYRLVESWEPADTEPFPPGS